MYMSNNEDNDGLPIKNEYIDKLTLELLLNKNHYNKYLSTTDPKKYDEYKAFKSKLRKYSIDIIDITSQLIENPKKQYSCDIEETFTAYVNSIFKHYEIKALEKSNQFEEDDDILFGNIEEQQDTPEPLEDETITKSFWGKERVVKKKPTNLDNFDIRMFANMKNKKR